MGTNIAVAAMVIAALVFAGATYKGRQPYEPGPGFRVPILPLQFGAILIFLTGLVYIIRLP